MQMTMIFLITAEATINVKGKQKLSETEHKNETFNFSRDVANLNSIYRLQLTLLIKKNEVLCQKPFTLKG